MKRIVAAVLGIALALSLAGSALAANWNSPPPPAAVNWSSGPAKAHI